MPLCAPGGIEHRVLVAMLVSIESLHIAWLVLRRIGHGEDARYAELRARWRARGREQASFAVLFQAQALAAAFLSLPFLLAAFNEHEGLEPLEWAGAALWVLAVSCEARRRPAARVFQATRRTARGGRCARASGRYSRHPNYFFQWLTWVAYALVALAAPYGWLGLAAPVAMLLRILFVTGIPPAEEQALRKQGGGLPPVPARDERLRAAPAACRLVLLEHVLERRPELRMGEREPLAENPVRHRPLPSEQELLAHVTPDDADRGRRQGEHGRPMEGVSERGDELLICGRRPARRG